MYINGYFMILYDLTLDQTASRHTSPVDNGNIRNEFTFKEAFKQSVTCLLYLEYDNFVRIHSLRKITTDFYKHGHDANIICIKKC
jgi:hypothetical protein